MRATPWNLSFDKAEKILASNNQLLSKAAKGTLIILLEGFSAVPMTLRRDMASPSGDKVSSWC
jgi:hypothetical protein